MSQREDEVREDGFIYVLMNMLWLTSQNVSVRRHKEVFLSRFLEIEKSKDPRLQKNHKNVNCDPVKTIVVIKKLNQPNDDQSVVICLKFWWYFYVGVRWSYAGQSRWSVSSVRWDLPLLCVWRFIAVFATKLVWKLIVTFIYVSVGDAKVELLLPW